MAGTGCSSRMGSAPLTSPQSRGGMADAGSFFPSGAAPNAGPSRLWGNGWHSPADPFAGTLEGTKSTSKRRPPPPPDTAPYFLPAGAWSPVEQPVPTVLAVLRKRKATKPSGGDQGVSGHLRSPAHFKKRKEQSHCSFESTPARSLGEQVGG